MHTPINASSSRRAFLRQASLVSLGFLALSRCTTNPNAAVPAVTAKKSGVPLVTDPSGFLDLPDPTAWELFASTMIA